MDHDIFQAEEIEPQYSSLPLFHYANSLSPSLCEFALSAKKGDKLGLS
jgi:hypothetical protein